jgi:tetratricopeptide (TPR) repeat protein
MVDTSKEQFCSDDELKIVLDTAGNDTAHGLSLLKDGLMQYPSDPRLHFLHGSLLAEVKDYTSAPLAMRRAVDLAPDFRLARFQLGFLLLTSGEAHAAQEAWGPLLASPQEDYLRHFVIGLNHLILDEFEEAIRLLEHGIAANTENPAMNRDMELIIAEAHARLGDSQGGDEPLSSAQLLLQQSALKATRH